MPTKDLSEKSVYVWHILEILEVRHATIVTKLAAVYVGNKNFQVGSSDSWK
jgi:hypothetical protein